MPKTTLLEQLRGAYLQRELREASDAQLLTRYLAHHEEIAFEVILRRHGPMVLGVCQRILGNQHEAEDAFQATFLVLVRKAKGILPRDRLSAWLHGVAQRTAMKARTTLARWHARGRRAMEPSSASAHDELARLDLQPILDHELAALADIYRLPIVLCDLEGKSRKEAAQQLGWKEGTLSGRLARGRCLLATRLTRRGVTLPTLGLVALLTPEALAGSLPVALVELTAKSATLLAAGNMAAVPGPVAALTREVLQTMLLQKLKIGSMVLVAVLLGMGGIVELSQAWSRAEPEAERPTDKERPSKEQKKVVPAIAGKIYVHRGLFSGNLSIYELRRKQFTDLKPLNAEPQNAYQADSARLSPDGRFLAFMEVGPTTGLSGRIQVRDVTGDDPPKAIVNMPGKELSRWSWSPDGKQLSFAVWEDGDQKYHPYVVDVATQKTRQVKLPPLKGKGPEGWGAVIDAWSPDGLWLVQARGHIQLIDPQTQEVRQVTTEPTGFLAGTCRFSPDGKKILFIGYSKDKKYNLSVLNLLVGKPKVLAELTGKWDFAVCWAPDSRHIACTTVEVDKKLKRTGAARIDIYDAENKEQPRLLIEEAKGWLTVTDWRR